ncbi:membrane progestin receptor delta isoform X1 [Stegostoma tigrinum]|uniref:membrane progestin receptor delta isoform X1 n=2 Tax=Stegostoma tigrinum TaxID=3053191 RepID=UPI00202B74DE|nr:membrane progestin receptor delta isoform X1 [Stegostoma tigrinum]
MLSVKLPQLLSNHQVPRVFREDGIISGYRHPRSSALDCLLSSFQMTNETVNIWTHFLPTWYFLWRFLVLSHSMDFYNEAYAWPLLVYMLVICLYPFISSCAHTFSTMSAHVRHICYFLDYGALSLYSLGCAVSYRAYVMPDQWINTTLHCYFTHVAVFNSLVCTTLSCYSRFLEIEQPKLSKALRITAFSYPFLFDNIPLFYRILLCWGEDCSHNDAVPTHYHHLVFAFLTCFLFASHLPERLAPGCFDYIGHSHQLFHICAIMGTHFQLEAIVLDMSCRHAWLLAHTPLPSLGGTLGVVLVSVVLNCLVIGIFVLLLLWAPRSSPFLQSHVPDRCKQKRE